MLFDGKLGDTRNYSLSIAFLFDSITEIASGEAKMLKCFKNDSHEKVKLSRLICQRDINFVWGSNEHDEGGKVRDICLE